MSQASGVYLSAHERAIHSRPKAPRGLSARMGAARPCSAGPYPRRTSLFHLCISQPSAMGHHHSTATGHIRHDSFIRTISPTHSFSSFSSKVVNETQLFHCLPLPRGSRDDIYELQSLRMVLVHNYLIRGYNTILYYAAEVPPSDTNRVNSFLRYCELINEAASEHHSLEEDTYFPWIESKISQGAMSINIEGHRAYEDAFKTVVDTLASIRKGNRDFVPEELQAVIYSFMTPFLKHLEDEIKTLRADNICSIDREDWVQYEEKMEEMLKSRSNPDTTVQLMVINGDGNHGKW
ncbi:hypothetical protein FRB95_011985 [Tulasnella sp. JGI-2019a]|nr:hypothetical protein FRB93_007204 [Tulasnella sp. JGI-2019a]KAG9035118.1 hypothetical protein FRB95_011985 [Tulasnella sp. JGI-2019a]